MKKRTRVKLSSHRPLARRVTKETVPSSIGAKSVEAVSDSKDTEMLEYFRDFFAQFSRLKPMEAIDLTTQESARKALVDLDAIQNELHNYQRMALALRKMVQTNPEE